MWITFFPSLIAVVSITIFQIGSGFVCLSTDRPTPVCLTYRSEHIFSHNGWKDARNFFLDPSHPDCQNAMRQKCCATWKLYYQPDDEWQLTEHLGIGYWCKDMNPAEQCLEDNPKPPMPYKKSKRYLPVDGEIPGPANQYDPDCVIIAQGNGDNGSPATLPEIHSDSMDDNQFQSQYNNNGNLPTSGDTAQDDGNKNQPSNMFAANDMDIFNTW